MTFKPWILLILCNFKIMAGMKLEEVKYYLEILETQLAAHLDWGALEDWKYTQFSDLSQQIEEAVGVRISYITLTRIFQEKQFKRSPQIATLNALTQFIGFQSWEAFCDAFKPQHEQVDSLVVESSIAAKASADKGQEISVLRTAASKTRKRLKYWLAAAVICLLVLAGFWVLDYQSRPKHISLTILEKASTFPAPIRIKYKVPAEGYSLLIHPLSANSLIKKTTSRLGKKSARIDLAAQDSIYLLKPRLPMGSYEAILLKDDKIIERALGINTTRGWEGILQSDSRRTHSPSYRPVVFVPEIDTAGHLTIPSDMRALVESSWLEKIYRSNYFLGQDFGLNTNECELSVRFRQIALGSMREPALVRVGLLTDDGMLEVPILSPDSDGSAEIWVSDKKILETDPILQSLYVSNTYQWQAVRLKLQDHSVHIYLNGKLAAKLDYDKPLGALSCVRIKFQGLGEIDDFELRDGEGHTILDYNFSPVRVLDPA